MINQTHLLTLQIAMMTRKYWESVKLDHKDPKVMSKSFKPVIYTINIDNNLIFCE